MKKKVSRPYGGHRTKAPNMLGEARAAYGEPHPEQTTPINIVTGITVTRLSSKNQITVPVAYVRALNLRPGDEVQLSVIGDMLVGHRRPQTAQEWDTQMRGAMTYPEWDTPAKIDAWVQNEHASWDREWDQDESS